MSSSRLCGTAILLAALAAPAAAQTAPRIHVGAGVGLDLIVGDASDFLDGGGSRFLQADFRITADDRLHVRLDGAFTGLDDDEDEGTGVVAENGMVVVVAGPQLGVRLRRFRPYAAVVAGFAAVGWETEGSFGGTSFDDSGVETTFAWGAHTGIGYVLDEGDHPVGIRIEARLLDAGTVGFARAPAFTGGQQSAGLSHEDFALFGLRIGMTLGF